MNFRERKIHLYIKPSVTSAPLASHFMNVRRWRDESFTFYSLLYLFCCNLNFYFFFFCICFAKKKRKHSKNILIGSFTRSCVEVLLSSCRVQLSNSSNQTGPASHKELIGSLKLKTLEHMPVYIYHSTYFSCFF
jgi:hypothetical protein